METTSLFFDSRSGVSKKKRAIRTRVKKRRKREVILFEDETDLRLFPNLRAGWAPVGTSAEVLISGKNAKRVVFGAMNIETGKRIFMPRMRQRQEDFQAFLKLCQRHYRGWKILMILDEDSSHIAKVSKKLAKKMKITLLWLPYRASKLNPLEELWGQAKDETCANWQYETIDDQLFTFLSFLYSLDDHEALKTSGVLSGNFWLKK
jgi:hypothetical protein